MPDEPNPKASFSHEIGQGRVAYTSGICDDARHIGPFIPNADGLPSSGYFFSINRSKESIALNLKDAADRAIFERLLLDADVLAENFTPGTMDRFGYGWEALSSRFPRLILASISGFGQTGPYRELPAYDMVVQAMGGKAEEQEHLPRNQP